MKHRVGFTLIELMVAVAIIAILSAIALPSYNEYVIRGRLTEATAALADLRVKLEQYYQDNRHYSSTATACPGVAMPTTPAVKHFAFTCNWTTGNTNQFFTVTASNVANQGLGAAGSYAFTINQANVRATTAFPGATVPKSCWISKKGESC
mgnify:FL=1